MKEYHKIETLFERDMEGNKKLIEGKFRNEAVEFLKDSMWIFTEKVDGTNIRIHWDGHTVIFGGRTDAAQLPSSLLSDCLYPRFAGTTNEQIFEQKFGATLVTLYGEGFGSGIQKGGGNYTLKKDFILFDVMVGDTFLSRTDVEEIATAFGVRIVPVVLTGTIDNAVQYVKSKPNSVFAETPRPSEGLVGVPAVRLFDHRGNRVIIKVKVDDFV